VLSDPWAEFHASLDLKSQIPAHGL